MPPLSGTYDWNETLESIVATVPLKNASRKRVDVYVARTVLKISYPPYLIDLDLAGDVDWADAGSKAIFDGNVLEIRLSKATRGSWDKLLFDGTEEERSRRRVESMRERECWANDKHEEAKKKRCEEERTTLRKQVAIEQSERQTIDDLKAKEKRDAEDELYRSVELLERQRRRQRETKEQQEREDETLDDSASSTERARRGVGASRGDAPTEEGPSSAGGAGDAASPTAAADADRGDPNPDSSRSAVAIAKEEGAADSGGADAWDDDDDDVRFDESPVCVPGPRLPVSATFRHTPRWFKTPVRESTAKRERDFVTKHRPYLKTNRLLNPNAGNAGAAGVEESDPTWLKSRGDDFCRKGDWRSAINAYSAAIEAAHDDDEENDEERVNDAATVRCLSNRAACYLRLGEAGRCVADCEEALRRVGGGDDDDDANLEEDDANKKKLRAKLHARRGTANCLRGEYDAAVSDLRSAMIAAAAASSSTADARDSKDALSRDLERVLRLRDASDLKTSADAAFGRGNLTEAIDFYARALEVDATFVGARSNRAACRLASGDAKGCVEDCSAALELLLHSDDDDGDRARGATTPSETIAIGSAPRPGTEGRRRYVATLLCRRGAARAQLGRTEDALDDLKRAATHADDDRKKESIERDVEALEAKLEEERRD